jgi:hypothetical protein
MANLAFLIPIRYGSGFQRIHGGEGGSEAGLQSLKIVNVQGHPAWIQPEAQAAVMPEQGLKALPEVIRF